MSARESLLQVGKECGSCDGQVCRHAPGCLLDDVVGGSLLVQGFSCGKNHGLDAACRHCGWLLLCVWLLGRPS